MKVMIGFFIAFGSIIYNLVNHSPLSLFMDLTSLIGFLGIVIPSFFARFDLREFITFSDDVCSFGVTVSILAGSIVFIINLIQMMQNMSDPSSIGPAVALSLLSVFYALIFSLAFTILGTIKKVTVGLRTFSAGVVLLPILVTAILLVGFLRP